MSSASSIPLVAGLRVEWAWHGDSIEGDYTPYMLVTGVDSQSVTLFAQARKGTSGGGKENVHVDTQMSRATMRDGGIYRQLWVTTDPLVMTNTTSMMLSSAVYNGVVTRGSSSLTVVDDVALSGRAGNALSMVTALVRAFTTDSAPTGTLYSGTVTRAETGIIPFTVLVNNQLTTLPTIHLRGRLTHEGQSYMADYQVLANPAFPLVLAADSAAASSESHSQRGGRTVSITFPDTSAAHRLEQELADRKPVEIYDIYFDYNSAEIKPESDSVLRTLGSILRRHPDWSLRVTGHTDSVGGSGPGNRVLSARRADAVRGALVSRYGVAANRLTVSGAGDSQPLATNATLEGRARNRRVELLRQ